MCLRLVSTFERCGHQDTVAHIQLCNKARACTPSFRCPLAPNDMTDPVYTIRGFCTPCSLNHAVLHQDGRLHEAPNNTAIVYHIENSKKAKGRVDITVSTQNNDIQLVWKEPGGGMGSSGSGDGGWADATEGNFGDWGAAKAARAGAAANDDGNAGGCGAAADEWGDAANTLSASQLNVDDVTDVTNPDATGGADEGSWNEGGQQVAEEEVGLEQGETRDQEDPANSMAW